MKDSIKVAIVGVGKITRDQHLPSIAADPEFELAAVVSTSGADVGVPSFGSLEALLADGPAIDAVAICTPPQVRGPIARTTIQAGLHVMLEKPPAETLSAFARLAALSRPDRTMFATWHSRYAPMIPEAAAWLARRRITSGRISWREDAHEWHPGQHWLWQPGGLGVFDPAINALSILTHISPVEFALVEAALEIPSNQQTPIAAQGRLVADEAEILLDLDFREAGKPRWDIEFATDDGGRLKLSDGGATIAIDGEVARTAPSREYPALYRRFAELIETGTSDLDDRPLRLVADAFMVGRMSQGDPFDP